MLLGLLKPTEGQSFVLGYNSTTQTKVMQGRIGYMSQLFTLYNDLTARENIRFYGQTYGLSREELSQREAELIEMAGLKRQGELPYCEFVRRLEAASGPWLCHHPPAEGDFPG